jgi:hypothetical protein
VVEVLHLPHPKLGGLLRGGEHLPRNESQQQDMRRSKSAGARSRTLFQQDCACASITVQSSGPRHAGPAQFATPLPFFGKQLRPHLLD